ncbi:MAG: hypothetical protein IH876_02350 [Gemmatimonadetes bacterium]|nr:hypothetical protein [Gemmatimonadota bacterium]
MILIYRKTDGVIVGEHPDDAKAERLANEYGSAFGVRVLPYPENRSWLEKAVQNQIKARVWREWKDSLWMNANKETLRQAESPGSGWTLVDPSGLHGEHIGDTAPGSAWQMTQDVEFADDTERAGKLSIDPTTGAVLMDGLPASVVMTVAATEEITVPAGTFSAFRIEITGTDTPIHMYLSADDHRVLKIVPVGQPVAFELVN